ncbi:MAG TPA: hypothetical protein VF702_04680 [Allosphingosinicella sp.]|jgi:heat shock protein HspQ
MPVFPCPADFAEQTKHMTNRQLAEKYGVGEKVVTRWRKEAGCTAAVRPFAVAALPTPHIPSISAGRASEAAQHLRKTHRPVYHRLIEGSEFRGQYVVGTQILSEQELLALALEKGFRAHNPWFNAVG